MNEAAEPDLAPDLVELKPFAGRIVPIIARACEACRWSATEEGDLVCRRNPPQVTFLPVMGMLAGRQAMRAVPHTTFPIVQRDQWCGEFEQRQRS